MKKQKLAILSVFGLVLTSHLFFTGYSLMTAEDECERVGRSEWVSAYFQDMHYLISISYALAASFTVYAYLRFRENKKKAAGGVIGGLSIGGVLYFLSCFLLGCCGSPMLTVYISLFGSSMLGFRKPLVFSITILSIIIGYYWLNKKVCFEDEGCSKKV